MQGAASEAQTVITSGGRAYLLTPASVTLITDPDLPDVLQTPGEVLFYVSQAFLVVAVALTLWSGWEFYRDVWRQRASLRTS